VSKHRTKRIAYSRAASKQAGVVLLVVLVVLVVLSLATMWAVKASISSEQLGNNIRISNSVNELAEAALRYCDKAVISDSASLVVIAAPLGAAVGTLPTAWAATSNWIATPSKINTVPSAQLPDAMGRSPTIAPVCMIEEVRMPPSDAQRQQAYLITVRAFSEDFRANSLTGTVQAGSDVWLQSMIRF
jgi:type IV pilus assembly protein PilX